jgi:hypothetical protein
MKHKYDKEIGACSTCGEEFAPNGTGPKGKWYTWIIKLFPFNRWVDPISDQHDIDYFEGEREIDRYIADMKMFFSTVKKIKNSWYMFPEKLWIRRAHLNYIAVRKGGKDSFNYKGCKGK